MQDSSHNQLGFFPSIIRLAAICYTLLLVYGTLFPFHGWLAPAGGLSENFLIADPQSLSKTDLITNFLVYLPFGLFWGALFLRRWPIPVALAAVAFLGFLLSFCLEFVQVFLPARISALSDLVLNGLGAVAGGVLANFLSGRWAWGRHLKELRREKFMQGALANIGLLTLAVWALSQLSPLVPSIGVSNLRQGLKPLWYTLNGQTPLVPLQALGYFFSTAALGAILLGVARSRRFALVFFILGVWAVLLLKVPVLSRQLSLEALLGCAAGFLCLGLVYRVSDRSLAFMAAVLLVAAFLSESLRPGSSDAYYSLNWIPFKGHMRNLVGLAAILWSGWIFLGIGYAVRFLCPKGKQRIFMLGGGLAVFCLAFAVEWLQRSIPGRYPDMTDVAIALGAWAVAWTGMNARTVRGDGGGKALGNG